MLPKPQSALLFLAASSIAAEAHAVRPLPGQWQQTIVIEVVDDETHEYTKLSEKTRTVCLSAEALSEPPLGPERVVRAGGTCDPVESKISPELGSELWRISCQTPEGKKHRMVSEVTYTESSMRSVLHSISEHQGEVVEGKVTTESKRVGACTP